MKQASISALCSLSSIVLPRRLLPMIAPAALGNAAERDLRIVEGV
jgi:hypothetical protein